MSTGQRPMRYVIVQDKARGTWSGTFMFDTPKGEVSVEVFGAKDGTARWQATEELLLMLAEGVLGGAVGRVAG